MEGFGRGVFVSFLIDVGCVVFSFLNGLFFYKTNVGFLGMFANVKKSG